MNTRPARALLTAGLAGELVAVGWYAWTGGPRASHVGPELVAVGCFVLAVLGLRRCGWDGRRLVQVVMLGALLLQVVALTRPPQTSDDDYRYIWDGKVQFAGLDPYRYAPDAPQLAHLRSAPLFGPGGPCDWHFSGGCSAINRPTVHTVYPPVAQLAFDGVRAASFGGHGNQFPFQVAGAVGALLVALLLLRGARRAGRALWPAALWAWCPVTVLEFGNNAHIDWLAVLFSLLALQATAAARPVRSGLLLGAAIATKIYPGVLVASMLARRPWLVLSSAVGLVALSYVPHVAAVGSGVIGYLPGYLHEEGYSTGTRFLLLGWVLPDPVDTIAGVVIVAAALLWAWRRTDPARPERTAVIVMGVTLLVTTPYYGWYAALLVALIAASGAWQWLPVAVAPSVVYLDGSHLPPQWVYLVAGVLSGVAALATTVSSRHVPEGASS